MSEEKTLRSEVDRLCLTKVYWFQLFQKFQWFQTF
jgi:hypothetical protein